MTRNYPRPPSPHDSVRMRTAEWIYLVPKGIQLLSTQQFGVVDGMYSFLATRSRFHSLAFGKTEPAVWINFQLFS